MQFLARNISESDLSVDNSYSLQPNGSLLIMLEISVKVTRWLTRVLADSKGLPSCNLFCLKY